MIASICSDPSVLKIMRIVNIFISIIRIVVPILLIFVLVFKLISAVTSNDNDVLAKVKKTIPSNIIAAVIIFLIPSLISIIVKITFPNNDYINCIKIKSIAEINEAYESRMEELVKKAEETLNINDYNNAMSYLSNIKDEIKKSYYEERLKIVKEKIDEASNTPVITDSGTLKIYYIYQKRIDAYLIIANDTILFIDGGYTSNGKEELEFIKKLGITRIDGLIGSHTDNNHIDAHKVFINNIDVGHVYYGVDINTCVNDKICKGGNTADPSELANLINSKNIPMTVLTPGENIKIGNITFDIVGPQEIVTTKTKSYPDNYNSLNMILKFGNNKFYFSGDGIQENLILEKYGKDVLDVDVFKYPHHGQNSISNEFMDALSPKYVIVPHSDSNYPENRIKQYLRNNFDTDIMVLGNTKSVLMESDGNEITVTKQFVP